MKTKKIVAVSSALMIGTTTALTGFPAVVLAQENMQEAVTSEQEEKCGIHSGARMDRKKCRIGSVTVWIR